MLNLNKPLAFLDIDGVLNSQLWFQSEEYRKAREIYSQTEDFHRKDIDPRSIEILNEIADWNFVLSSTWRRIMPLSDCQRILSLAGFKGTLIDKTPILNNDCLRGNEIYKWLQNNELRDFENYIILDDDSDMLYWQRNNYFQVDGYVGITPNIIYRAKRFLKIDK